MFTNEAQDTTPLSRRSLGTRMFSRLGRLGSGAHFVAMRVARRTEWFTRGLTVSKFMNMFSATAHFAARSGHTSPYPVFVIIDISPLCNLHCTVCVHAYPHGNPELEKQTFRGSHKMSVAQYRRIIDEIKGHTLGVLLYYVGDPLMHPDLEEICRLTNAAGLNAHVSTNFSFRLSDERIKKLVTCGLTHLTVCVDGLSQEKYQMTRVGGRLDWVMSNLKRACDCRRALGRRYPRIEVQYIKFQHNLSELAAAHRIFRQLGADQVHELWGWLHNYTDREPGRFDVYGPRPDDWLPACHWPHFFTLIKYNGDVIPCCAYRLGEQYVPEDHSRAVGNVFETSLREVWNSPQYRAMRRWVSRPSLIRSQPELGETFCDGCPRLFETNYEAQTCRYASEHRFEDLYALGEDGRPVRRSLSLPVLQAAPAGSAMR